MTLTLSLAALARSWDRRLRADSNFATLVGSDGGGNVRLYHGWPQTLLDKPADDNLPRVTYMVISRRRRTGDPESLIIQSDIWEWPRDSTGGQAAVDGIDEAMLDIMSNGEWGPVTFFDTDESLWVQCRPLDAFDPAGKLRRRTRDWELSPC